MSDFANFFIISGIGYFPVNNSTVEHNAMLRGWI